MRVYLNGQMIEQDLAAVSLMDAAFQHAVGLFETMAARHGCVFRLDAHLQRLAHSAAALGLARQLDSGALRDAVQQTLVENKLGDARVRLTVTAGQASLLRPSHDGPAGLTVAVVASEPVQYDPAYFERGITALIAADRANPFDSLAGYKTLAYWGRLRTLRHAASGGAGEAIWLSVSNHLASGSISNLFLVKGGHILTPIARGEEVAGALPAPVLPGVTRAAILELAAAANIQVNRKMLSINDLLDADEIFLTNSSWHVLPVTKVEKKPIGDGKVGPVTAKLRQDLLALIARETSGN